MSARVNYGGMPVQWTWVYVLAGVLLGWVSERPVVASICPVMCFCPSISRIVYCARKSLPFIPTGIPAETVQINLNDNPFFNPVISQANFSRYIDLEHLYLTGCGIEYIEVDTFVDNKKLIWLDIGKNKLKTISDFTFRDLTLKHLFLSDNPGVKISSRAFSGLKSVGLYIQNNGIDKLSLEVLRPMNGTLKTLWLDGNKFEGFGIQWLYLFKTLSHLRIGDNPLHCNCEARWLFLFYSMTSRIFEGGNAPMCRSPGRLRGKNFSSLQEDDFKCQLPVFKNVDVIFEHQKGKFLCLASGDPVPTIYWINPDGEAKVFISKSDDGTQDMEGVMYVTNPRTNIKNRYMCVANNPAGNVTFSINVAWPTGSVVSEPPPPRDSPDPKTVIVTEQGVDKEGGKEEPKTNTSNNNASKTFTNQIAMKETICRCQFGLGDVIGSIVGTFLLTLLLCVCMFHVFHKYKRKNPYPHHNGLSPGDMKKGPPSRYELDEVEHTMKMLGQNGKVDIRV